MNFNLDYFKKYKWIKKGHIRLLLALYEVIFSDKPPASKMIGRKRYYNIRCPKLQKQLGMSVRGLEYQFRRLEGDAKNKHPFIYTTYKKRMYNKDVMWVALNEEDAFAVTGMKRAGRKGKEILGVKMDNALFDTTDVRIKLVPEADSIARSILRLYPQYFKHKVPTETGNPTKTYIRITHCIADIYNGQMATNRRMYSFNRNVLENKTFDTSHWERTLLDAKGDWMKVKRLVLNAAHNFDLMHSPDYKPYDKTHLQDNLAKWFYDDDPVLGEPRSQFILCLEEPPHSVKFMSEQKADEIFDTLPMGARKGGNMFYDLDSTIDSGKLWENIRRMTKWCETLFRCDRSARYWADTPSEVIVEFAKYCKENRIDVSPSTLDIPKSVARNMPWKWFVKEAANRCGMSKDLCSCSTPEDIENLYDCGLAAAIPF